jgi:predicted MFS family arabinose efflux permease
VTASPSAPLPLAIGGLVSLASAMGVGRFVYTPILPFMTEGLGLSQSQAGLIASANFAGYLIGALLAALPTLPGSRRTWVLGALGASAVTTGAMGFAESMGAFLVLRFVSGLASAFAFVFSAALVLDRLAAMKRPDLTAVHFAGVGLGIAGSAALVSALAVAEADWRILWWASGVVSLAALFAVAALVPDRADATPPPPARPGDQETGLTSLIVAYGLFGFGYVITATFLVALVRATPAMQPLEPMVWILVGLSAAPSVALWTWIGRKIGVYPAFALACVVEAFGVGASVLWSSSFGAIAAAVLLGGTFVGITAVGVVAARRLSKGNARSILALMTAAFGLGQIVGPVVAGLAFDATGSFTAPSLAAAAALLVSGLLVLNLSRAAAA